MVATTMIMFSPQALVASAPDIERIADAWRIAAASVRSLKMAVHCTDDRPTQELLRPQKLREANTPEISLDFELEYSFARDVGERIARRGKLLAPKSARRELTGFMEQREIRTTNAKQARGLVEGGQTAEYEYDQFTIQKPRPLREPVLQTIRNLLDMSDLGTGTFFTGRKFQDVSINPVEIRGTRCRLAESAENNGIRLWYETEKPHRIRQMELGYLAADQNEGFTVPSGWQITIFGTDGTHRMTMNCRVTNVTFNAEFPEEEFELSIPPGAIVVDDRNVPSRFALQLADGSSRELSSADMIREHLVSKRAPQPILTRHLA